MHMVLSTADGVETRGKRLVVTINTPTLSDGIPILSKHANGTTVNQAGEDFTRATAECLQDVFPVPVLASLRPLNSKERLQLKRDMLNR